MKRFMAVALLVLLSACVPVQKQVSHVLNDVTDSLGVITVVDGKVRLVPPVPLVRVVLVINGENGIALDEACAVEAGIIICEWPALAEPLVVNATAVDAVITASYRVAGQTKTRHEVYSW